MAGGLRRRLCGARAPRRRVPHARLARDLRRSTACSDAWPRRTIPPTPATSGSCRAARSTSLARMPERARYLRGMTSWIGFRQVGVSYERRPALRRHVEVLVRQARAPCDRRRRVVLGRADQARHAGRLRAASCFCVGVLAWSLYTRFFTRNAPQGWTSVIAVVLLLGGVQLLESRHHRPVRRADLRRDEAAAALLRRRDRRPSAGTCWPRRRERPPPSRRRSQRPELPATAAQLLLEQRELLREQHVLIGEARDHGRVVQQHGDDEEDRRPRTARRAG